MRASQLDDPFATVAEAATTLMSVEELRRLASLTGGRLPTRKADLVQRIVDHLAGDGLQAVWEELDETQMRAVAEVVHSSGHRFCEDTFHAKYGTTPVWGSLSRYRRDSTPTHLWFFFYGASELPADLKTRLRAFVPPPEPTRLATLGELPEVFSAPHAGPRSEKKAVRVRESEHAAQRELLAVLRLIDAGQVSVGAKTHRPAQRGIDAVATVLENGDYYPMAEDPSVRALEYAIGPIRAFAWPVLLLGARLAEVRGTRLHLTQTGRRALGAEPAETIRTIWRRWLDVTSFDELTRIDVVKGQGRRGRGGLSSVKRRRRAIQAGLKAAPPSHWFDVTAFRRYLRASGSDYGLGGNLWGLYIENRRHGALGYEGGDRVLGSRYLWCVLFEYASTLGMLDVAFVTPEGVRTDFCDLWGADCLDYLSRYDGLLFARLTPLGAYCLGVVPTYAAAKIDRKPILRVLANREIAVMVDRLDAADRLALDTYALPASERTWRLDQAHLLTALEAGHTMSEVREYLTARGAGAIPPAVARFLDDLDARSKCVLAAGQALLFECRDSELATRIAHDVRTRRHCMLAGDRSLAVSPTAEGAFRRGLRKSGYVVMPLATGTEKRDP